MACFQILKCWLWTFSLNMVYMMSPQKVVISYSPPPPPLHPHPPPSPSGRPGWYTCILMNQSYHGLYPGFISGSLSKIQGFLKAILHFSMTGPRSAVGNVSGYRCVSDCRSRGREFDPGPVPYFRGDWSWNNFYGHSPSFRWFIQEGLLSVTSESMCTNYWLTACSSLPRKKCG